MGSFLNTHQITVCIRLAYTTGYMTILGQCIFQNISYHQIVIFFIVLMGGQEIIYHLKCMTSVVIIRIDNCKRCIQSSQTAQHCMTGSPWFYSAFRYTVAFRKIGQFLEYIRNFHDFTDSISYGFFKIFFIFFFNNENNFFKSCFLCIIQREIHNDMAFRIDRIDLF